MKKRILALGLLLVALFAFWQADTQLSLWPSAAQADTAQLQARKKKNTPTPKPSKTPKPSATPTAAPADGTAPTPSPIPEGPIIDPQSIADYLFAYGELPDNFITKAEAQKLGWGTTYRYVSDAAPGYSIGGDYFGNYEGLLPKAKGRKYYECDCWYESGPRSAYRIIYSNDGLVFYTEDHYESFTEMHPWTEQTGAP